MPDLLVPLYDLPDEAAALPAGILVRRGKALERRQVVSWIAETFGGRWASECEVAFSTHPIGTFIAVKAGKVVGFACYDGSAKGFFGPTGVAEPERGQGIGEALLMATLRAMREVGYAYAVIGDPGPVAFYRKRLAAFDIPNSAPGFYRDILPRE